MPRRHTNAGNRPRGLRSLEAIRQELGLPSEPLRTVVEEPSDARTPKRPSSRSVPTALMRSRDQELALPMHDHDQGRPERRTARVHVPPPELGERHELRELDRAWVRDRVACPRCGAAIGTHCRGRSLRRSNHLERLHLAQVPRG